MDPDEDPDEASEGRRIRILHAPDCRCRLDGAAIYVVAPCTVIGTRVTKHRLAQLRHSLRKVQEKKGP